jgi:hypothetical protein
VLHPEMIQSRNQTIPKVDIKEEELLPMIIVKANAIKQMMLEQLPKVTIY